MPRYAVYVTKQVDGTVYVKARDEDAARKKVEDEDYDIDDHVDIIDPGSWEIDSAEESDEE